MKITNEFTVNTPIDRAWTVLTDLEGIAPCLPGAHLTGVEGDTYTGKVKVKVGPVVSDFTGTARFVEKDDHNRRAVIDAKGRDARSAGNAAAVVTAQLRPDGDRTLVSVDTDLKISGKLAQFGSGMIKEVSGKLLNQFVTNLEAKLAAEQPAPAPAASASAGVLPSAGEAELASTVSGDDGSVAGSNGVGAAGGVAAGSGGGAAVGGETVSAGRTTSGADQAAASDAGAGSASGRENGAVTLPFSADTGPAQAPVAGAREWIAGDPHAVEASGASTTPVAASGGALGVQDQEPEPLDLLALAGGSVYKRAIPVGIGVVAVAAVIIWFVARR